MLFDVFCFIITMWIQDWILTTNILVTMATVLMLIIGWIFLAIISFSLIVCYMCMCYTWLTSREIMLDATLDWRVICHGSVVSCVVRPKSEIVCYSQD